MLYYRFKEKSASKKYLNAEELYWFADRFESNIERKLKDLSAFLKRAGVPALRDLLSLKEHGK